MENFDLFDSGHAGHMVINYLGTDIGKDIDDILRELTQKYNLGVRRLFYFDGKGNNGEIIHVNGIFKDFADVVKSDLHYFDNEGGFMP